MRRKLAGAAAVTAIVIGGCSKSFTSTSTIGLLNAGSAQVCSSPDVQETVRKLLSPAEALAGSDALTAGVVKSTRIEFELTTLEKFDASVKAASCSTNVKFTRDGQSSPGMNLDFTVQPSAEKPEQFVIKAKTEEVQTAYLLNLGAGVAKAREQQQSLAAASAPPPPPSPPDAPSGDEGGDGGDGHARPTRYGLLEVRGEVGDQRLYLNGTVISPNVEGNNDLRIVRLYKTPASDIALMQIDGGTACPLQLNVVAIERSGYKVSGEFGTCTDEYKASQDGDAVVVRMGPFRGNPGDHTFVVRDGRVTDNGKSVATVTPTGDPG